MKSVSLDQLVPGAPAMPVTGLTADSRRVQPGFLFAALSGTKADGAVYVADAVRRGAVAILCAPGAMVPDGIVAVYDDEPRRALAVAAARFYGSQPARAVAVTGTNGKTSVAAFVREMWTSLGFRAASIGTVGIVGPDGTRPLGHTTPDPVELHEALARLAAEKISHVVLEASSHGLAQYRLDGVRLEAAAFTNLTRDHLDFHASVEEYFSAKIRLFDSVLKKGAAAIINLDSDHGEAVLAAATRAGLRHFTLGRTGADLKVISIVRDGLGQIVTLDGTCGARTLRVPLMGEFQASNALVALGLLLATGSDVDAAFGAVETINGARGRLDLVGTTNAGAPVLVDYAHTPDALDNALRAVRPFATGKLAVVFGCGGDRDKGKRPQMGAIAAHLADRVYITDDNPRTEDPASIRAAILANAPGAVEIADRAEAIATAIADLRSGDVLLVAGKGHEEGQTRGGIVHPFSDHAAVAAALEGKPYHG